MVHEDKHLTPPQQLHGPFEPWQLRVLLDLRQLAEEVRLSQEAAQGK
jgi:hypothetical protein